MKPTEHHSVQARIIDYAKQIGWNFVPQVEAEKRRRFSDEGISQRERSRTSSIYFDDLVYEKAKRFNPKMADSKQELIRKFNFLKPDIFGNRDFLNYLRGEQKYYDKSENRELDLKLIDFDNLDNNTFEITEEFYYFNGKYPNREDIVFLVNGMPVIVIECKNCTKDEGIALGISQINRYQRETPELFVPEQIFTATESIGFSYGVTWNIIRRNIFNWKEKEIGNLESKVKSFFDKRKVLDLLQKYIMFTEKDEELTKLILRQHQQDAVKLVVNRAHDENKTRGLVWHTQGSGKTYTMIKIAELLFKAPESDKPTILLILDRNELEDQMIKNLQSVGMQNVEKANSIAKLKELLKDDFRGIIVTMIHKFRDTPANLNTRKNIYVLIDEAHRTTGGDLGNFLMASIPNATFIGFTGTPVDKTVYGKGTFKTFGIDDNQGYLHKYSISESIEDKTTLPLFYSIAPSELLVPKETLEEEFLTLSDDHGVTDIEELNKILEKAINTKNFLKAKKRIEKIAEKVAEHYKQNVEPLGYKAFLVGVDREACAFYKEALDKFLPSNYSEVVYTGNNNDSELLKKYHHDKQKEREIRKKFASFGELPKILIVTEKLLTGYDAPLLYAMYLDKPLRDHTLLQAIARVNRPYENIERKMVKPHGFVMDFVGIFDNLEKALAFDSDEIDAVIKDIQLLKSQFKSKMGKEVPAYLELIKNSFNDKDTDNIIEYFRDKERRKKFFKLYKEVEMLYEIISPDAFLRPFIEDYSSFSSIYGIVRNAYAKKVYVDREFLSKTSALVQKHVGIKSIEKESEFFEITPESIQKLKDKNKDENVKVINLIKSIEKIAEDKSGDPFLISLLERAEAVKERYESRQLSTKETLAELLNLYNEDIERREEQKKSGFEDFGFYIFKMLDKYKLDNKEQVVQAIETVFENNPNWFKSGSGSRELRNQITFALLTYIDEMTDVKEIVDEIFNVLFKIHNL